MTSEWVEGEYIEIIQNPYYWKNPRLIPITDTTTDLPTPDFTLAIVTGMVGAAAVIVVGGFLIMRKST